MALSDRAITPSIPCEGIDGSFFLEDNADDDIGRQYMAVKVGTADNQVMPLASSDTAGTKIVGFLQADANDGDGVQVRVEGVTMARAEGTVTRDDELEAIYDAAEDKNGNLKTITPGSAGQMIAARALESAADAEYFKVQIVKQLQTVIA